MLVVDISSRAPVPLFMLRVSTKWLSGLTMAVATLHCALLAHTEETLQHIVNRFSDAAKNFGLTISLKKTEVLYQPPPRVAYSPPHISIDGTDLNAAEHFIYLGSVNSKDATVSKDLDNRLSKASSPFGRLSKRVCQRHSLCLSTKLQVYRAVVVTTLLYGVETVSYTHLTLPTTAEV